MKASGNLNSVENLFKRKLSALSQEEQGLLLATKFFKLLLMVMMAQNCLFSSQIELLRIFYSKTNLISLHKTTLKDLACTTLLMSSLKVTGNMALAGLQLT